MRIIEDKKTTSLLLLIFRACKIKFFNDSIECFVSLTSFFRSSKSVLNASLVQEVPATDYVSLSMLFAIWPTKLKASGISWGARLTLPPRKCLKSRPDAWYDYLHVELLLKFGVARVEYASLVEFGDDASGIVWAYGFSCLAFLLALHSRHRCSSECPRHTHLTFWHSQHLLDCECLVKCVLHAKL